MITNVLWPCWRREAIIPAAPSPVSRALERSSAFRWAVADRNSAGRVLSKSTGEARRKASWQSSPVGRQASAWPQARAFIANGTNVLLADRDGGRGASALEVLGGGPGKASFLPTDVTDVAAVFAMVQGAMERVRQAGLRHPQRRDHRAGSLYRQPRGRRLGARAEREPDGSLALHEGRNPRHGGQWRRRNREYRLNGRAAWRQRYGGLQRQQARCSRTDEVGSRRICGPRHPHQRRLPRRHGYPHARAAHRRQ